MCKGLLVFLFQFLGQSSVPQAGLKLHRVAEDDLELYLLTTSSQGLGLKDVLPCCAKQNRLGILADGSVDTVEDLPVSLLQLTRWP